MGTRVASGLIVVLLLGGTAFGQEGLLGDPPLGIYYGPAPKAAHVKGLAVDTSNRSAVADFFFDVYMASEGFDAQWTGSVNGCIAGTTATDFRDAVALRINFYRAMAGVPAVVAFSDDFNAKCQVAALMMRAEGALSHNPPANFECFTADGAEAAANSNLALNSFGPDAVDLYMRDSGANNTAVGHRRWILFPPQETMGAGDVTAQFGANALWVIGGATGSASMPVAWPPEGFVPEDIVFARWSYSSPGANFSQATVTMTENGSDIPVVQQPIANGFGDNTVVWEPNFAKGAAKGAADMTVTVRIDDVIVGGQPEVVMYDVTIFDPAVAGPMDGAGEGNGDSIAACGPTGPQQSNAGDVVILLLAITAIATIRKTKQT